MIGNMGLQVMSTSNPEFNWKTVTKGRRTRKSKARSISSGAKVNISTNPKRVGDHFGFDSTKFGEIVIGQSTFDKSESIPIKKRRHVLQSVSTDTCKLPFCHPEHESNEAGDFSGIELLAAAASMDDHGNSSNKEEPIIGDSTILKKSGVSSSTTEFDLDSGNQDRRPSCVSISKVNRLHWDLNTLMDAWDEPYDDSITGNSLEGVKHEEQYIEDMKRDSSDHLLSYLGGAVDELCALPGDSTEPLKGSCTNVVREVFDEDTEEEVADEGKQVLSCNNHSETSDQVMKVDTISGAFPVIQDEISSINPDASERTSSDLSLIVTENVIAGRVPAHEISGTTVDCPCKNIEDSWRTCGQHGANIHVSQSLLNSDSRIQDGAFVPSDGTSYFEGHVFVAESVTNHESTNQPSGGPTRITLEDSCFESNAAAQLAEPTFSAGKIGSIVPQPYSVVSQYNLPAAGYGLTKCQDRYDSPYEDGELRGSLLYSWVDNELADECVDYECDERNGDDSDTADYPGSVTVEGASEGSYGTKRSPFVEGLSENNKSESVEPSLCMHFVKDDPDNTEVTGKASNAGSGTTVDQRTVVKYQRDGLLNRRRPADRRSKADVNVAHIDEYVSKTASVKLHLHNEGCSSLGTNDENEALFVQQSRTWGSIVSPDRRPSRYGSSAHRERDGVHYWASGDSRRQHTSGYHGSRGRYCTRPRGITRDKNERQNAKYMSKGLQRGINRKSSEESVDFFRLQRRMALTRSVSNYRTRGRHRHSLFARSDFVEDFVPSHDEADVPTRLSRHLSRKDQGFSPNPGRGVRITLPHKRSRSRSPRPWYPPGEQIFNSRRHTRPPNFRAEEGMKRMRVPFSKPSFASDFGQWCVSPSSGHISSPEPNCRWVDDHPFTTNHLRRRRSPVREYKHTQQFDDVASSGRVLSDEHFRPIFHPRNYSFKNKGGRTWRLYSNIDDRRHIDSSEFTQRGFHSLDSRDVQPLWHNVVTHYETNDLNGGDDVRVADPGDATLTQQDIREESI